MVEYKLIDFDGKLLVEDRTGQPYDSVEKIMVEGEYVEITTRKYRVDCPVCPYNTDSLQKIEEHVNSNHTLDEVKS